MNNKLQGIAVSICILLAVFGAVFAGIGAWQEVSLDSPGSGLVMIVIGTIALGFSSIGISIAGKLLK